MRSATDDRAAPQGWPSLPRRGHDAQTKLGAEVHEQQEVIPRPSGSIHESRQVRCHDLAPEPDPMRAWSRVDKQTDIAAKLRLPGFPALLKMRRTQIALRRQGRPFQDHDASSRGPDERQGGCRAAPRTPGHFPLRAATLALAPGSGCLPLRLRRDHPRCSSVLQPDGHQLQRSRGQGEDGCLDSRRPIKIAPPRRGLAQIQQGPERTCPDQGLASALCQAARAIREGGRENGRAC
jgi:hypothetical protein